MPESGSYGSVRGAVGNSRPYRERRPCDGGAAYSRAGVRKPPKEETAMGNVDGAARTTRKKAREQVSTRGDFRSPSASKSVHNLGGRHEYC